MKQYNDLSHDISNSHEETDTKESVYLTIINSFRDHRPTNHIYELVNIENYITNTQFYYGSCTTLMP